jgi:hypothetical protein
LIPGSKEPYLTIWGSARVGGAFSLRVRLVLQRLSLFGIRQQATAQEGVWIG